MQPIFSKSASAWFSWRWPAAVAAVATLAVPALAVAQNAPNAGASVSDAGNPAATPGTPVAEPAFQPLPNPLNRNPARQTVTIPDIRPAVDNSNSSSRPTLGAVTSPDSRDTLVMPDPSRDSTTNPVANSPR